ncbi:hypothetical protein ScPMuIL_018710 [Solemya velum]
MQRCLGRCCVGLDIIIHLLPCASRDMEKKIPVLICSDPSDGQKKLTWYLTRKIADHLNSRSRSDYSSQRVAKCDYDCAGNGLKCKLDAELIECAGKHILVFTGGFEKSTYLKGCLQLALKCCLEHECLSVVLVLLDCNDLPQEYECLRAKNVVKVIKSQDLNKQGFEEYFLKDLSLTLQDEGIEIFPAGNLAVGMAHSHYFGLLKIVLPKLEESIEAFCREKSIDPAKFPAKYYELLPKSCKCQVDIKTEDGSIKPFHKLLYNKGDRNYNPTVYCIEQNGEKYYCSCGYPSVVDGVYKMDEDGYAKIPSHERKNFLYQYFEFMKQLVNNPKLAKCYGKHRMLVFDDEKTKPYEVLLEAIRQDIKMKREGPPTSCSKERNMNPLHRIDSKEESSKKYDVCLVYSDMDDKGRDIAVKLRRQLLDWNQVVFEDNTGLLVTSMEKALEQSRWVILILFEKALSDPMMMMNCCCAVDRMSENRWMNIIPVIDGPHLPKFLHHSNYIDWKDNYFSEKLKSIITGEDIEFPSSIPIYDLATGLAWGLVINYLQFILQALPDKMDEALEKIGAAGYKYVRKQYNIFPSSCIFDTDLSQIKKSGAIKQKKACLEPVKKDRAGCKERQYNYGEIYEVKDKSGEYLVLAAIARPCDVLYKMAELNILSPDMSRDQVQKLQTKITEILRQTNALTQVEKSHCENLFWDDSKEQSLADFLLDHVKKDLESQHAPHLHPNAACRSGKQGDVPNDRKEILKVYNQSNGSRSKLSKPKVRTPKSEVGLSVSQEQSLSSDDSNRILPPHHESRKNNHGDSDNDDLEHQFHTVPESVGDVIRRQIMDSENEENLASCLRQNNKNGNGDNSDIDRYHTVPESDGDTIRRQIMDSENEENQASCHHQHNINGNADNFDMERYHTVPESDDDMIRRQIMVSENEENLASCHHHNNINGNADNFDMEHYHTVPEADGDMIRRQIMDSENEENQDHSQISEKSCCANSDLIEKEEYVTVQKSESVNVHSDEESFEDCVDNLTAIQKTCGSDENSVQTLYCDGSTQTEEQDVNDDESEDEQFHDAKPAL